MVAAELRGAQTTTAARACAKVRQRQMSKFMPVCVCAAALLINFILQTVIDGLVIYLNLKWQLKLLECMTLAYSRA